MAVVVSCRGHTRFCRPYNNKRTTFMRVMLSSILRAVCAAAVGYLLVMYRDQMVQWITIAIGGMFLISGIISVLTYYSEKRKARNAAERLHAISEMRDGTEAPATAEDIMRAMTPSFPIVGIGSILLGVILAVMPAEFIKGVMYSMAAILILGGLTQLFALVNVRKLSNIPFIFWVFPCVIMIIGVYMIVRPMDMAELPFRIIGWGLVLYAIVEVITAINIYRIRRRIEEAEPYNEANMPTTKEEDIEDAEIVETL